jgi:hypothetical protein
MSFEGLLRDQQTAPQTDIRDLSLGEELIATARETMDFNPVQALSRGIKLREAYKSGRPITADVARAQLRDANLDMQLTIPDQGITQEALDIIIQRKRIENANRDVLSRSPGGFGRGAARLAVGFGVSLFDPINLTSGFIPVVSQARYASLLRARSTFAGRTAVRAGVGAVEGAVGAAVIEPLILSTAQLEQADYDAADSLLNIAFGAGIGSGLHVIGGSVSEAYRRSRGLPPLPPERQIDDAVRQAIEADQALPPIGEVEAAARALDPDDVVIARNRETLIARAADAPVASREQLLRELTDAETALSRATDQAGATTPLDARIAQIEARLRNEDVAVFGPDQADSRQVQRLRQRTARKQAEAELRNEEDSSLDLQINSKARAERASRELLRLMSAKEARRLLDKIEANKPLSADEMATLRAIDAETMPGSARNVTEQILPETRRAALSTGIAQAMQSRTINVEPIVNLDPSQRQNAPVDPMVSARNAAIENARPDQAAMVDFDAAAEIPEPRAVPMLDAAAQSLDEAVAAADEAVAAINAEGQYRRNLLVQEEGIVYGDVPDTIDAISNIEAAFERAKGREFPNNREFKKDIQDAVNAAARESGVDLTEFTPDVERYLVRVALREARIALRDNSNAIGWYNEKVTKALRIISLIHPEILSSREDRLAFTWALAVTSNGLKVDKNFELAIKAYEAWRKTGTMPDNVGIGTAAKKINDGLRLYNVMLKQHGFDALEKFMRNKDTVKNITGFSGLKITGENMSTEVYGSAVLGPKIGNGFFSNLYGNFEQLTIDRWLMRTWGRWTGTLIEENPVQVRAKRKSLTSLVRLLDSTQRKELERILGKRVAVARPDELAFAIAKASMKPENRAALNAIGAGFDQKALNEIVGQPKKGDVRVGLGDEIRKAGNALSKYLDGQKEAPDGPPERGRIRKVFGAVLERLQKDNPDLTMADLQALLWYPEKRLYDAAGASDAEVEAGYADDAAPDYANAAAKLAEERGISRDRISGVTRAVDEELQAEQRARRTGRGDLEVSRGLTVNEGLQRYLAEGPVRSQAGPGAVAAQRQAVRAVEDLRSTDSILGLALSDQYAERQRVSLVGQKVADHADLAVLAQVYRDPRFETLRYFFVDRNDNIIAQAGLTSRLPGSAAAIIGDDPQGFYGELVQRAIFLGAKGVYMLHNHPSTNPTASVPDIDVTRYVSKFVSKMGVELKGHVIIDTNQYTVIDAEGNTRTIAKDFGQADPKKLMDIGSKPLTNPDILVNIAKQIEVDEDAVVIAVANAKLEVQNLAVLPSEQLRKGSAAAKSALMRTALEARGSFLFAIGKNMETLGAIKDLVVDSVFVSPDGRYVTSGNAAMRSPLPQDRRARASADTSPAFDYLRQVSLQDAKRMRGVAEEGGVYEAPDTNAELRPFNDAIQRADIYARAVRAAAERIGNDDAARAAMQAATNNQLGAYEIDALLEKLKLENQTVRSRLRKAKAQFTADETADALQSDAMRAANAVANNVKLDATIAARNAALGLAARTKIVGRVITEFAQNPKEGILAVLGGSSFAKFGAKDSVFHWQRTYFTRWTKGMLAELEQAKVGEAFMSNAYARDVARALYQLGRENPRLEGLADEAVTIAKIVYKYREDARNTRNRFGAWIRDLTGYITRQQHDFTKIKTAGAEEWKAFVRQRLDIDRTLEPGQNLEEFLDFVYSDFSAGRQMAVIDDEAAAYTAPGSLARRASQSRVLYFLDADAEFDYLEKFGAGKLNEAVLGDLSRAAQQAGLMRILGPNPEYTLKASMAEIDASIRGNAELREQFSGAVTTANELLTMLDGRANIPGSQISARVGSNIRALQAMSKLGGAVISAVTDLPVYASQIRYQGRGGLLAGIGDGISSLLQGRAKGERRQILNMIDTVSENVVGGVAMRFDSDDVMSSTSADLMRIFFRLNGLTWWTDTLREGMEIGTANWLGNLRNTAFDAISADSKNVLQQYGISAPEWDVMRQAFVSDSKGKFYVVPESVTRLSPDVIRQYLATIGRSSTDTAVGNARRDLADRLRNLIVDQAMTAVIEPDVRSRYFWSRGTKPGSFYGEIARYISQFKGFPTALTRQVFGREIYGRGYNSLGEYLKYGKGDMLGLAQLILAMTAFGYIAMAAKDLLKAKTPRDPTEPQTWIAAMLQGGALGIYGDFLLGQSNRFGRNIVDTLVGPTFGVLGDLDELRQRAMKGDDVASSAFRMLIANTPFMNLFYSRIVLDYLILYQIQEALDPGALRRMERRVEREQNQEFLLAPSEVVE